MPARTVGLTLCLREQWGMSGEGHLPGREEVGITACYVIFIYL